jgi:hypothetical protein
MVSAHPGTIGSPPVPKGSVMVWKADSEETLRELLSKDPFVGLGVWDLERATIVPFLCAVRKSL